MLPGDARVQLRGETVDAAAPVVGVEACVEACHLQRQFELQRVEEHHAQGHEPIATRQREAGEVARRHLDRVEPDDVVEQRAPRPDARTHQAWQHVRDRTRAPHILGAAGELAQFAIRILTEQRDEFALALAAREQALDRLVVQPMRGGQRRHDGRHRASLRAASVLVLRVIVRCGRRLHGDRHRLLARLGEAQRHDQRLARDQRAVEPHEHHVRRLRRE